ncbi:hypothetical protein [Catenuloplanes japonicus]|uniref:hypothetical protein n=1 Tax=Catenuloplanes japonicus TaxID=33876 RepID=UPI0005269312|nr:hypothetical protein [Catenuloplanes japonicus]
MTITLPSPSTCVLLPARGVPGCDTAFPEWLPPRWRRCSPSAFFPPVWHGCGVFRPGLTAPRAATVTA